MIAVLIVVAVVIWVALALVLALAIGMGISEADRRASKPCCPHEVASAPETVRGQFCAVVPVEPVRTRLDVKL